MKAQEKKEFTPPPPHCVTHSTIIYIIIYININKCKKNKIKSYTNTHPTQTIYCGKIMKETVFNLNMHLCTCSLFVS